MSTCTAGRVLAVLVMSGFVAGCGGTSASTGPNGTPATSTPATAPPATTAPATTAPTGAPSEPPATEEPSRSPSAARIAVEPFVDGLDAPVFITHAGDGSGLLYVVEQPGRIRVVDADGRVQREPFLDIRSAVVSGGERGLLGLAFHPRFAENGRFFVMYTAAGDGANTVAEYRAEAGIADARSGRVLVAIDDFASNHNGGMVAFGSDGYLYAGTGDGGGGGDPQGNGQRLDTLLGKLLRIDVDRGEPYGVPDDNPFVGDASARPEIWALGLRNPWRFSFDRQTGDVWIGDVGQGMYEEIDAAPGDAAGRNYGWNLMEGPACFAVDPCDAAGLTLPVATYGRDVGSVVAGGYVYRGDAFPGLRGTYLYADIGGPIFGLDAASAIETGSAVPVELGRADGTLVAFGEDEAGELYLVDLGGAVMRISLDGVG